MELEETASEGSDSGESSSSDESLCEEVVEEEGCREVVLVPARSETVRWHIQNQH